MYHWNHFQFEVAVGVQSDWSMPYCLLVCLFWMGQCARSHFNTRHNKRTNTRAPAVLQEGALIHLFNMPSQWTWCWILDNKFTKWKTIKLEGINIIFIVIRKNYWSVCAVHFICKVKCSTLYIHAHGWQVMVWDGSGHCLQSLLSLWPCLSGDKNKLWNSPASLLLFSSSSVCVCLYPFFPFPFPVLWPSVACLLQLLHVSCLLISFATYCVSIPSVDCSI